MWVTTSLRGLVSGVLTVDIVTRACTPATRRAWCRRRSASPASCSTASKTRSPAPRACPSCRSRSRPTASRGGGDRRRDRGDRRPLPVRPRRRADHARPARDSSSPGPGTDAQRRRRRRAAADRRAGNVLRPRTSLKLSFRLPPTATRPARSRSPRRSSRDPPYGARVSFDRVETGPGWNAPAMATWLVDALDAASTATFGRRPARSARAARFRSWACSANGSPTPSS